MPDAFQANAAITHIQQRQTVKKQGKEALVDKMEPSLAPQARGGFSNHYVYFSNPVGGLSGFESKLEKLGMQQLSPGVWHESNPYLIAAGITNSFAEGGAEGAWNLARFTHKVASHATNYVVAGLGLAGIVGGLATGSPMLTAASGYGLMMNGMGVFTTRKQLEHTNRALLGNQGLKQAMVQITETGDVAVDRQLKSIQKMTEEMTRRYRGSL